jgi:Tol biopolymer transport system component
MAELKEIFDMVTQKTEPKEDAWREQEERQRRETRSRRIRAYTAVAAVIVVALVAVALLGEYGSSQTPATTPTPSVGSITHFLVDVETGEQTPLPVAMFGARLIDPSPDGTMFAYNGCCSGLDPLILVSADGTERTISPRGMSGYAPAWTPDGSTIVFQGRNSNGFDVGALYAYDVATKTRTRLIDFAGMKSGWWIVQSDVSPDGSTVLFNLARGKPAREDLWTIPIDGGARTLVRRDAGFATYGPDGSIVFLDHPKDFAGRSMWIMDADGSNAREIVSGEHIGWPHVSPDGSRVAYASDRRIYVVGTAGGKPVEVATDSGLEVEPAWVDNNTLIVG